MVAAKVVENHIEIVLLPIAVAVERKAAASTDSCAARGPARNRPQDPPSP